MNIFKNEVGKFYIIGVHKQALHFLEHEIAHGLFYTNDSYRAEVQKIISQFDIEAVKEELRQKAGYHEDVLEDEVHAYSIDMESNLRVPIPEKLSAGLRKLYEKYFK